MQKLRQEWRDQLQEDSLEIKNRWQEYSKRQGKEVAAKFALFGGPFLSYSAFEFWHNGLAATLLAFAAIIGGMYLWDIKNSDSDWYKKERRINDRWERVGVRIMHENGNVYFKGEDRFLDPMSSDSYE